MPKFSVTMGYTVQCYATFDVDANNSESAENAARNEANANPHKFEADWSTWDDLRVVSVNRAPTREAWCYRGHDIYPADANSSGIRWYTRHPALGMLRADSKRSMRRMLADSAS